MGRSVGCVLSSLINIKLSELQVATYYYLLSHFIYLKVSLPCHSIHECSQQAGAGSVDQIDGHCFHQLHVYTAKREPKLCE